MKSRLKDLGFVKVSKDGRKIHKFLCTCGKTKLILLKSVKSGHTRSCGCLLREIVKVASVTHGLRYHPLYKVHQGMLRRCFNINGKGYKNYGGRGIKVSKRWLNVKTFIEEMSPTYKKGLSLERINNDGDYSKRNCRWATQLEQAQNTRKSILYKKESASRASVRLGGSTSLIKRRISRGWTLKKAFTTPIIKHESI